jgi:NAD(P)H-dependent FMN reductase
VFGGARAIENLKPVLSYLGLVCIRGGMTFGNVNTLFDEQGAVTDPAYVERASTMLKELEWYARTLKAGREAK